MRSGLWVAAALLAGCARLGACTAFCLSNGREVLFANNEDYHIPQTKVWFVPGEKGAFGRVYVGFGDNDAFPQGGMNERGLVFDMFSSPPVESRAPLKPGFRGNIITKMMAECATVEEAVRLFEQHSRMFMQRFILMVADASGDSAVIEQDAVVRKQGPYQVQTNFYQSRTKPGEISCERYKLASAMLEAAGGEVSAPLCRRILAAVHQEGNSPTLYSNVYDLKRKVMHLYHFHNYENVVTIDLAAELKKGRRTVDMASLFPPAIAAVRFRRAAAARQKLERRAVARVDAKIYDEYAGRYEVPGMRIDVTREGGRLYIEPDAIGPVEILPESDSRFFVKDAPALLRFVRGPDGKVREMVLRDHGADIRFPRIQ